MKDVFFGLALQYDDGVQPRAVGWAELAKPIIRGRCASFVGTSYEDSPVAG